MREMNDRGGNKLQISRLADGRARLESNNRSRVTWQSVEPADSRCLTNGSSRSLCLPWSSMERLDCERLDVSIIAIISRSLGAAGSQADRAPAARLKLINCASWSANNPIWARYRLAKALEGSRGLARSRADSGALGKAWERSGALGKAWEGRRGLRKARTCASVARFRRRSRESAALMDRGRPIEHAHMSE